MLGSRARFEVETPNDAQKNIQRGGPEHRPQDALRQGVHLRARSGDHCVLTMPTRRERIEIAVAATTESKDLDFKERFDPTSARDWCEIVKDIVAMANTRGGCLVFGVRDDGTPSGWDPSPLLHVDSATVTDKVARYTGRQFADFENVPAKREKARVAVLVVDETRVPMPFSRPGTYAIKKGRQRTVFAQGTVYFRHGSKSEPATAEDMATVIDRRLAQVYQSRGHFPVECAFSGGSVPCKRSVVP